MNFFQIYLVIVSIKLTNSELTSFLREYIERKRKLQKYSITTFVDYEKNQSGLIEENLYLNLQDYVSINDSFHLKGKLLNISVFHNENHEFDCHISTNKNNETTIKGYSIELIKNLQEVLLFR